jgi:hypothetical protein
MESPRPGFNPCRGPYRKIRVRSASRGCVTEYCIGITASVRFGVGCLDDRAPLLDSGAETSGRLQVTWMNFHTLIGNISRHHRIRQRIHCPMYGRGASAKVAQPRPVKTATAMARRTAGADASISEHFPVCPRTCGRSALNAPRADELSHS